MEIKKKDIIDNLEQAVIRKLYLNIGLNQEDKFEFFLTANDIGQYPINKRYKEIWVNMYINPLQLGFLAKGRDFIKTKEFDEIVENMLNDFKNEGVEIITEN